MKRMVLTPRHRSPSVCLFLALTIACAPAKETIEGLVVAVADGDTFTVLTADSQRVTVRLAEVDAPEIDQPYGRRSLQQLSGLILHKRVRVETQARDDYGRIVGRTVADHLDISEEMIRTGSAWVYRTYSRDAQLYKLENLAKASRVGLWSSPQFSRIAPWDWRHNLRSETDTTDAEGLVCGAKRYCGEMGSCAEARFYLTTCGLARLDGDDDGIPCEAKCN